MATSLRMDTLEQLVGSSNAGSLLMKQMKRIQEDRDTLASLITSVVKEILSQPGTAAAWHCDHQLLLAQDYTLFNEPTARILPALSRHGSNEYAVPVLAGRLKERLQAENIKPAGTVFCSLEVTCLAPRWGSQKATLC